MRKRTIVSYLQVVLGIAVPLSLFEIWIDSSRTGRLGGFCFERLDVPVLNSLVGDCMVTPYHLTMFLAIVPALCGIAIWFVGKHAIRGILAKLTFFFACVLGVIVVEDASWFTLNTMFRLRLPDALPRLLHGEIGWFPRWIDFGLFKVPDFYVYLPLLIVILLAIEHLANRKTRIIRPPTLF